MSHAKTIKSHKKAIKMIEHNEEVFDVLRDLTIGAYRLLWVNFPQCPNGHKIMVYYGIGPDTAVRIMPHFGRDDSPVARLEPTERGWRSAIAFADTMNELGAKEYAGMFSAHKA